MTLSDALVAAEHEGAKGVVLRDAKGTIVQKVFVALGGLWVDRGNPSCLEPYQPTVAQATSDRWRPARRI